MKNRFEPLVQPSRRSILSGGLAASLTFGVGPFSQISSAANGTFDPSDPVSVLRNLHRMRGSEEGLIAMGWLKGQRYGVVDAEIIPLMGMVTGTFARHKILADGSIELTSFELAFYTDLETGKVLDTLQIPYTGKTVEVPRLMLGPNKSTIRPVFHELTETGGEAERTDSETAMRPMGSIRFERWLGPVTVKSGNVWITEASSAKVIPADPTADKVIYSESVTYKGDYEDVTNPDLPTISSTLSYTGITSWRPWMQMGDLPGHTTSHALGSKAFDVEGLPDDYREMAEQYYPEALADPQAVLDKLG
ncbi:MAG: DUF1838 domain-containing protein [Alphaproteobacteria bacterium]|nr:DUF1838 domain-containing protein [Alphaproteobacteria bacterium]